MMDLPKGTIVSILAVAIGHTIALGWIAWLIVWSTKEILEAAHPIFVLFTE